MWNTFKTGNYQLCSKQRCEIRQYFDFWNKDILYNTKVNLLCSINYLHIEAKNMHCQKHEVGTEHLQDYLDCIQKTDIGQALEPTVNVNIPYWNRYYSTVMRLDRSICQLIYIRHMSLTTMVFMPYQPTLRKVRC